PSIGPCCYEVGDDVVAAMGRYGSTTTRGSASVDLWSAAEAQLGEVPVWRSDLCTYTDRGHWSYRRDATKNRQVAVAWVPRR
ncbi:MAG: laccase domain-containing protein, partial [Acidimicrobiia bacterium]